MNKKRTIPYAARTAVLARYGVVPGVETVVPCHYCQRPGRVYWKPRKDGQGSTQFWTSHTFDHVVPEFKGGDDTPANLVLACRPCNLSKGTGDAPHRWAIERLSQNIHWKDDDRQRRANVSAANVQ